MTHKKIILNFIYKFFCILKAAADGWIVRYIGGNQFEFMYYKQKNKQKNIRDVFTKYTNELPSIITTI
jgi:hypothetical protein